MPNFAHLAYNIAILSPVSPASASLIKNLPILSRTSQGLQTAQKGTKGARTHNRKYLVPLQPANLRRLSPVIVRLPRRRNSYAPQARKHNLVAHLRVPCHGRGADSCRCV